MKIEVPFIKSLAVIAAILCTISSGATADLFWCEKDPNRSWLSQERIEGAECRLIAKDSAAASATTLEISNNWGERAWSDEFTDEILTIHAFSGQNSHGSDRGKLRLYCSGVFLGEFILYVRWSPSEIELYSERKEFSDQNELNAEYRIDNGEIKSIKMENLGEIGDAESRIQIVRKDRNMKLIDFINDLESGSRLRMRTRTKESVLVNRKSYAHVDISLKGAATVIDSMLEKCADEFGIVVR